MDQCQTHYMYGQFNDSHTYLPLLETCSDDSSVLSCCSVWLHGQGPPMEAGNSVLDPADYMSLSPSAG